MNNHLRFNHLKEINDALLTYPDGFNILKKLNKVLEKRHEPFNKEDGLVDWAQARTTCICDNFTRWYTDSLNWSRS